MADHISSQDKHHFSPVFKNGGYAMSTVGRYAVSFLLGALSAAFVVGSKTQNITDLIAFKGKTEATLERMDTFGTNASKMKVEEQNLRINGNTLAILDLQKRLEPLGTMQSKIERLERDMATKK
jgi:hypothetical protein